MTRPVRLAVLSALALAVLGASAYHVLPRPRPPAPPGRLVVVVNKGSALLSPTEQSVVAHLALSGLHVVSTARVYDPISRSPVVVTTSRGVLVITDSSVACRDAAGVAQDLHLVGSSDPTELGRLRAGRIAGALVLTTDSGVWTAVDADPC